MKRKLFDLDPALCKEAPSRRSEPERHDNGFMPGS
jgi:hypothetical protein